jgi:hypothetical protein
MASSLNRGAPVGSAGSRSSIVKKLYQLPPVKRSTVSIEEVHMRVAKAAASLAVLGSMLLGGAPAFAATPSTPAGGTIKIYVVLNGNGAGPIVITGAIGDYGRTLTINKNGTPDPNNGNYVKITLQKGTFEVNKTTLDARSNKAQPSFDAATCSASLSVTGPITLFDGKGLYAGIGGTINVTINYGFVLPRLKTGKDKGQCNESNSATPLSQYGVVIGAGAVSFR